MVGRDDSRQADDATHNMRGYSDRRVLDERGGYAIQTC